ncbi:MAG: 30S ribosome-binding factor RbfA [Lachnospiraceae bacterium]|nr:30S ribosome-binding factor RbfA [Lachnospiraceae bacterium]MBR2738774.1 30S ribosome-binding factor RbfA [Lachnospiraceae bacterium]
MKKNSVKNHRLNAQVQRDLSEIIRSLSDPGVSPMTTVTRVEITPDLKFGKVYISVIGSEEDLDETMAGIKRAAGYIRRELAHTANLRITPELTFVPDRSIAEGIRMAARIDAVLAEDAPAEEDAPQEADKPETEDAE